MFVAVTVEELCEFSGAVGNIRAYGNHNVHHGSNGGAVRKG